MRFLGQDSALIHSWFESIQHNQPAQFMVTNFLIFVFASSLVASYVMIVHRFLGKAK